MRYDRTVHLDTDFATTVSRVREALAEQGFGVLTPTKVRALAGRGAPRDLIDVFAASRHRTNAELEEFGRRHARGRFERDLQANLTGADWTDDEAFAAYGLDDATITALRTWAANWADDLAARLLEEARELDID